MISLTLTLALQAMRQPQMGTGGWAFMGLAWLGVLGLTVWCFSKVIWGGKPE